jgi:hypothetical protein
MIKTLNIENIGNIKSLSIELGKVNVFVGENLADQSEINVYLSMQYTASSTLIPSMITPLSPQNLKIIKNKIVEWFFPIVKDLKQYHSFEDYHWRYQSEYDNQWYDDPSVSYVIKNLHSVLNPELGALVLAQSNFGGCLNPRLARKLLSEMIEISEKNEKQIILFTHQPNVLDALDLTNDAHRLFVLGFRLDNSCQVTRIQPMRPLPGKEPVRLSEAFMRGYIGGLPEGF